MTASGRRPGKAAIIRAAVEVIAEDGFEGASTRDMAARGGVSVAALYHHFPSKLGLLREFLDEAYAVTLARIERRLDGVEGAVARLENVVGTLVWTHVHDEFARRASIVAVREYTRLDAADRAAVEVQRKALLDLIEGIVRDGIRSKAFRTDEPREVARVRSSASVRRSSASTARSTGRWTTSSRSTSGSRSTSQVLRVRDGEFDGHRARE